MSDLLFSDQTRDERIETCKSQIIRHSGNTSKIERFEANKAKKNLQIYLFIFFFLSIVKIKAATRKSFTGRDRQESIRPCEYSMKTKVKCVWVRLYFHFRCDRQNQILHIHVFQSIIESSIVFLYRQATTRISIVDTSHEKAVRTEKSTDRQRVHFLFENRLPGGRRLSHVRIRLENTETHERYIICIDTCYSVRLLTQARFALYVQCTCKLLENHLYVSR